MIGPGHPVEVRRCVAPGVEFAKPLAQSGSSFSGRASVVRQFIVISAQLWGLPAPDLASVLAHNMNRSWLAVCCAKVTSTSLYAGIPISNSFSAKIEKMSGLCV